MTDAYELYPVSQQAPPSITLVREGKQYTLGALLLAEEGKTGFVDPDKIATILDVPAYDSLSAIAHLKKHEIIFSRMNNGIPRNYLGLSDVRHYLVNLLQLL